MALIIVRYENGKEYCRADAPNDALWDERLRDAIVYQALWSMRHRINEHPERSQLKWVELRHKKRKLLLDFKKMYTIACLGGTPIRSTPRPPAPPSAVLTAAPAPPTPRRSCCLLQ